MSVALLVDHHGVIYRATEVRDELGDVTEVWTALAAPTGLNCRPNQNWSGDLQDHGPGEQQGAKRQWFLVPGFDVQERDVLSIESGQETGVLLRIHSVTRATAPLTLHHYEVNVEVWKGSVVDPEDGS